MSFLFVFSLLSSFVGRGRDQDARSQKKRASRSMSSQVFAAIYMLFGRFPPIKGDIKKHLFWTTFGSLLNHFWTTFRPLFGSKMESKVTQTPTQTQTHRRMRGRARKIRNHTFKNKDTASKKTRFPFHVFPGFKSSDSTAEWHRFWDI